MKTAQTPYIIIFCIAVTLVCAFMPKGFKVESKPESHKWRPVLENVKDKKIKQIVQDGRFVKIELEDGSVVNIQSYEYTPNIKYEEG